MARNFGTTSTSNDEAMTPRGVLVMSGASQSLVLRSPMRQTLLVSNHAAANPIFLALGPTAVANQGIRLNAGQSLPISGYTGVVSVIGTAADVVGFVEY